MGAILNPFSEEYFRHSLEWDTFSSEIERTWGCEKYPCVAVDLFGFRWHARRQLPVRVWEECTEPRIGYTNGCWNDPMKLAITFLKEGFESRLAEFSFESYEKMNPYNREVFRRIHHLTGQGRIAIRDWFLDHVDGRAACVEAMDLNGLDIYDQVITPRPEMSLDPRCTLKILNQDE